MPIKEKERCRKCTIKGAVFIKIIDFETINEYADTMKKTLLCYPAIFISTVLLCLLFLLATTLISQDAIREHTMQSAEYFKETALFEYSAGKLENFKKDNYADCISTGIAWHFGEGAAYTAIISANYNHTPGENVNVSFEREMLGEEAATENYSRYWHGSAGVIRVLLLFTNIETARYVIATIGLIVNAIVVISLMRKRQIALGLLYAFAFLLVNGLFALTCMEYAFIFLIVPAATLFLITNKSTKKAQNAQLTFLVIGILTAFFDFLTAETLTFTVPFAVYFLTVAENGDRCKEKKKQWCLFFKSGAAWLCGYGGMFVVKWFLVAALLGKGAAKDAILSASERIGSEIPVAALENQDTFNQIELIKGILVRNLGCLYWGSNDMQTSTVLYITLGVALVLFVIWYMLRKEKKSGGNPMILVLLAVLPYIRMILILNHSYLHYFFTYRAQMITVMLVLYLIYRSTWLSEGFMKRK